MSGTTTPDRSVPPAGHVGFARTLHAEWTKFRTVRGWVLAVVAAGLVIAGLALAPSMHGTCGTNGPNSACTVPLGPGGEPVTDQFTFVHRPLVGDGSLTVRVTDLAGKLPEYSSGIRDAPPGLRSGVMPWAKAGILVKDGTAQGSAYAAMLVTGDHGVRLQSDFTGDVAGLPGIVSPSSPRWLRLTRTGGTLAGAESVDGVHWTTVGTVHLAGLPATIQAGLFATSPQSAQVMALGFGLFSGPTQATGTFDHLALAGNWSDAAWTRDDVGAPGNAPPVQRGAFQQAGGTYTVSGSGDIAPAVTGASGFGTTVAQALAGIFLGLIVVVVVATLFVTAEFRRGLICITFAADPRRGRVLAAKAVVVGVVTFLAGLAAAVVAVPLGTRVLRASGIYVYPASTATELRVIVGTAAVLAMSAVLALALGTVLRRGGAAVAAAVVVIVLPYLLAISILPVGAARWLLRFAPAAAFAVQQTMPQYAQVDNVYAPAAGYYPLPPWAGFAVLCGWTALALGLAAFQLNRSDV
ncbi:MAG TPA: hypothetical protein VMU89_08865 [Thermomicrobiaceae bacterium]|nr:hypothetical protein [Thermomicrobiaceae bacterium]